MIIKTFIVDDEAPARRELRFLLQQFPEIEIVGEAANSTSAFKGIRDLKPQLVFLDVQIPGMTGLELAQFLCELPEKPIIVFATAFDGYALQAFEVDALDYLSKPFTRERLSKTVAKVAKALVIQPGTAIARPESFESCRKVTLLKGETIIPTAPERIIYAHCEDGDTIVHTLDGRYRSRCTLNELEHKLASVGFARPHRSFLVNINHVSEVVPWFNGSYKLFMDDGDKTEIPVSRYNVKGLRRFFDL
ncbi:MAG TPA: LytTR family DNA-binding domain-containing protein [Deltaproteobacteria bacterium]|nr:LytTR family DNA-binding domain-containing protein [Deltaproteobacteria bacterium]